MKWYAEDEKSSIPFSLLRLLGAEGRKMYERHYGEILIEGIEQWLKATF